MSKSFLKMKNRKNPKFSEMLENSGLFLLDSEFTEYHNAE